ncbi:hypothetical protein JKF63_03012 [Porcisia hertigi]|uniref:DNA 3'-5' helicase n=1 Tax=Porcisia hertigi TaxID=2761500 RepID=A0A836L565_9TRYP|nr:hypothetical protein JKF63_03012 [Porcisia hertigi]
MSSTAPSSPDSPEPSQGGRGKRLRENWTSQPSHDSHAPPPQSHPEESIPYLATISMNQVGFLRARRCTRDEVSGVSLRPRTAESELGKGSSDGTAAAFTPELSKTLHSGTADDISYLEQMLTEIMEAAVTVASTSPSPRSYTTQQDGETLPACAYLLRTYLGIDTGTFKPRQQEVCLSILAGVNTLAVCPTGWGKSLCYQFPMLVHRLLFECRYARWCLQATLPKATLQQSCETAIKEGQTGDERSVGSLPRTALPADLFSRFCVVVSPLLALMEDQAEKINRIPHLTAFVLSSKVSADSEERVFSQLESPLCPLNILFVSPEKFIASVPLRRVLHSQAHRLALMCVDEVHCVSGWAYDFRPTFMYLSRVLHSPLLAVPGAYAHEKQPAINAGEALAAVPYLCLTATATSAVVRDVQASFSIVRTVTCGNRQRENLHLQVTDLAQRHASFHHLPPPSGEVAEVHEPSARVTQDALLEAVQQLPKPMIVYVQSRADADALSGLLSSKCGQPRSLSHSAASGDFPGVFHPARYPVSGEQCGLNCHAGGDSSHEKGNVGEAEAPRGLTAGMVVRCYHAALTRTVRSTTQRQFLEGKIDILVATIAFGMGIDKANIRSIIHASAPSSLEGYVQEIGRAGRDGAPSICRILYNPFDFYALRCRLWSTLLSLSEMQCIVGAILSCATTRVGQRLMLVSVSALSAELGFTTETIETVLFLLLTATGAGASLEDGSPSSTRSSSLPTPFKSILGSYPLGFKVLSVQGGAESPRDPAMAAPPQSTPILDSPKLVKRRRTVLGAATRGSTGSDGVALLLRQLGATDAVLELCRVTPNMSNLIEVANRLSMPLAEFQHRMQDLVASGTVTLAKCGTSPALLLELSESFAEAASPATQQALASHILALHRGRLDVQVAGLRRMFGVLQNPSHDAIAAELNRGPGSNRTTLGHDSVSWKPPGQAMGKLRAVSVVNAFVEENRLRIHSTYEALRALLGIRPKSLIQHGKYAGQLPLAQSWYVKSPYFGALRTFELSWVLQVLAPHQLDVPPPNASG